MVKIGNAVVILLCTVYSVMATVEIALSGTVKNTEGAVIDSAVVTLASDTSLKDTTNADGEFAITTTAVIGRNNPSGNRPNTANTMAIRGRQFRFSISSPANDVGVSIFSGNGRRNTLLLLGTMAPGVHTYTLPELAPGFYIMQVTIDRSVTAWNLVATGTAIFMSSNGSQASRASLVFRNAAVESVDTLIVKKNGYQTTKMAVASRKQTGIAIVLYPPLPAYGYGATVENTCADCEVPALPDAGELTENNSKLPDPFKKIDGTRITKKSEWRCRRQEILAQAMKYIYGDKPAPPEVVSGSVTNEKITVHVEDKGTSIDFSATIKLPATGTAPYPAIISVGSFGGILMGEQQVLAEGVAIIMYDNGKIGKEQQPEGNVDRNRDFQGLFYDIYGGRHSAGLLMAWAWGASRMIDVLQQSGGDIIDYRRLGVTGCSRTAKAAFAIGLFDERIALTLPEETSIGGIPAYRIADKLCSENTDNNFRGQLWLSNVFSPFVKPNTNKLPIDAHELVATFAPRGLYSMENSSTAASQMCDEGGNMAIEGGMDVYKALGAEKNLTYRSDTPAGTQHCSYTSNFTEPLKKNITRFLKHGSAETGGIVTGPGTLNRADWIDWEAPTLEDDTDLYDTE